MIKPLVTVVALVLAGYLVWGLRSFIVPASVGGLLAYICRPLVTRLERFRIPRGLAVGLLVLMFGLLALVGFNSVRAVMPSETEALALRVRALYALNHRYSALMGLDPSWTQGNRLYRWAHRDLDPLIVGVSELLALAPDERAQFIANERTSATAISHRLLEYERSNEQVLEIRARRADRAEPVGKTSEGAPLSPTPTFVAKSGSLGLGDIFSTWSIAPLIFLFLLQDTGTIKRSLLSAVPNRLFEPALAVLADVDHALGDYMRALFLECCLLGLTVMVLVAIVGVPLRWAVAIGIFAGASNVIPYMGSAAALLGGLSYALLAENVNSILPVVSAETFAFWVLVAVLVAELIKNVVYEPIVVGRAVKLHPLAVVIGVVGGATLFGPAGLFLAIPTITVVKVFIGSSARHFRAYGLI